MLTFALYALGVYQMWVDQDGLPGGPDPRGAFYRDSNRRQYERLRAHARRHYDALVRLAVSLLWPLVVVVSMAMFLTAELRDIGFRPAPIFWVCVLGGGLWLGAFALAVML